MKNFPALFLLATIAAPSYALRIPPPPNPDIVAVNRNISLSYLSSWLYYKEPSANSGINTGSDYLDYEQGGLNGGKIALSWMTAKKHWYFHGEWAGAEGRIPYTGYTQITLLPVTGTSRATVQDYDVKFGRGFPTGRKWMMTPYGSFGGRHWTRVLGLGTPGNYNETYNHYYFAVGSLVQYAPAGWLVATFDAAFGGTMYPTINDPPDGLSRADLGTSAIAKVGLEIDGRITPAIHMFSGFDYMGFGYGKSSRVPAPGSPGFFISEPDSQTQVYNFTVGLRYTFSLP